MRFPVSITYADTNETLEIQVWAMFVHLVENVCELEDHTVILDFESLVCVGIGDANFIPFIQNSPNVPAASGGNRLSNGRIPSAAQVAANSMFVHLVENVCELEDHTVILDFESLVCVGIGDADWVFMIGTYTNRLGELVVVFVPNTSTTPLQINTNISSSSRIFHRLE
jgi:hypothetical protein